MVSSSRLPEHQRDFVLKHGTEIVAGLQNGHDVMIVDDNDTNCWVAMWEYGVLAVIMARTFEDAYGALLDELPTIPQGDLADAYGAHDDPNYRGDFAAWIKEKTENGICPPDLVQGYEYQDNATGTGIVDVGHCLHLRPMTVSDARALHVEVRSFDAAETFRSEVGA